MAHRRTAAVTLLQVRALTPSFGVGVELDLSEPLDPAAAAELRALFDRHLVLLFREQRLPPERHIAFARNFGRLEVHVLNQYHADRHPELFVLSNVGPDGRPNQVHPDRGTLVWHTDGSFQRRPALATVLYAEAVPRAGGHTLFADTLSAFEALSPADQERLAAKRAVHDLSVSREKAGYWPLPRAARQGSGGGAPPGPHPSPQRAPGPVPGQPRPAHCRPPRRRERRPHRAAHGPHHRTPVRV